MELVYVQLALLGEHVKFQVLFDPVLSVHSYVFCHSEIYILIEFELKLFVFCVRQIYNFETKYKWNTENTR